MCFTTLNNNIMTTESSSEHGHFLKDTDGCLEKGNQDGAWSGRMFETAGYV